MPPWMVRNGGGAYTKARLSDDGEADQREGGVIYEGAPSGGTYTY